MTQPEQETLQRKEISERTDAELEHMSNEIGAVIDGLLQMEEQQHTEEVKQERETLLQDAFDLGEMLAIERIGRAVKELERWMEALLESCDEEGRQQ